MEENETIEINMNYVEIETQDFVKSSKFKKLVKYIENGRNGKKYNILLKDVILTGVRCNRTPFNEVFIIGG